MIHAYNEYFVSTIQEKLGCMYELAVIEEGIDIDEFTDKFLASPIAKAFETANSIYIEGKSAVELLALVLNIEPKNYMQGSYASPEYWVGYVLAYAQWYLNLTFSEIIKNFKASKILKNYFPYHEMDITHAIDLFKSYLPCKNTLKEYRTKKGYSQSELAILSNVPIRNIRAYEQGKLDISKASADSLYALSKALGCTIEDLIR